MSLVPASVNFLASAAASAAKARGVLPSEITTDGLDVAVAMKCISSYQLEGTLLGMSLLDDEQNAAPLIAAARTLLSCAEQQKLSPIDSTKDAQDLYLFAGLAHAMYGNFPSAKAAISNLDDNFFCTTPMRCIAGTVLNSNGSLATRPEEPVQGLQNFRGNWYHALRERDPTLRSAYFVKTVEILGQIAVQATNSSDRSLALNIELAMNQAYRLATIHLHESAPEIPEWFVKNTVALGILTLLPPQFYLLVQRRLALANTNSLLTLPTSTGKTLIAEACMAAASHCNGISIYVAPYVAIGEQVRSSLSAKTRGHIPLISMFGGFKLETTDGNSRHLVVMTPERLDGWLRGAEDALENLRLVVFDEMHIIENGARGARVEGLISRLRLLQRRLPHLRILGLSAVLAEPERICAWMGVGTAQLHRISWRPTARRLAVCRANGEMHWVHGNDALRPANARPDTPISRKVGVALPNQITPSRNPVVYEEAASHNISSLALSLLQRLGTPGLIVCRTRTDTRMLAKSLAILRTAVADAELTALAESITQRYAWLGTLSNCLRHGVAFHNASLPYDVRRDVEKLIRARKLQLVCATTTLAEGADLPFRWTLVAHWLGGDGLPMKSMTFRNIAGRSGRAGAFTEGDTILFENRGGPPDAFIGGMDSKLNSVMFSSSSVTSTAGDGFRNLTDEQRIQIEAAFSSQLLAALKEHQGEDNIVSRFQDATYANFNESRNFIDTIINSALPNLLSASKPGGALAVINSPIRLTLLGETVNRSGFSPESARAILQYLSKDVIEPEGYSLVVQLLILFSGLAEQQNLQWKTIVNNPKHRFALKLADMISVLNKLAAKEDLRKIFDELPARQKSKASEIYVDKQFDKFVTLVDGLINNFLPWLLRAISVLAPFGSKNSQAINWTAIAQFYEPVVIDDELENDVGDE